MISKAEREKAQEEHRHNRIEYRQYLETCGFIKEQLKRAELKNCDEFCKMMEEHVASGILTAKIHWRDYCMKAVALNTSGSTTKDMFEDVAEELEKLVNYVSVPLMHYLICK
ncbi:Pre-mRNA-processing protein 40A [Camellia lanceoleosa]|uniref:Pre-mRNA-processing protein 40A n=1 Tax=Camellia lanceoleosa TaxID=1840588 RepID=A0ACC0HGZ9_9ERIC|nr:Pre-mRNA-processing protein 40A [Camellia lanceoleosa]